MKVSMLVEDKTLQLMLFGETPYDELIIDTIKKVRSDSTFKIVVNPYLTKASNGEGSGEKKGDC